MPLGLRFISGLQFKCLLSVPMGSGVTSILLTVAVVVALSSDGLEVGYRHGAEHTLVTLQ